MNFNQQVKKEVITVTQNIGYDLIIVGGGPAGVMAAILATNRGIRVLLLEEVVICSNLYNIPYIEDLPFSSDDEISGTKLAETLMIQLEKNNIEIAYERVIKLEILKNTNKKVITQRHVYFTKTIILASGMQNRKVKIEGSDKFYGRGLSYCAACDALSLVGKDAMISGNNEYSVKTALYLTNYVHKLYLVTDCSNIQATEKIKQKILSHPKIQCYFLHKLDSIYGKDVIEKIQISSLSSNKSIMCNVSGVFIYHDMEGCIEYLKSNSEISIDQIDNDFINTSNLMETTISGVYVIGSLRNYYLKRIITFSSEALIAVNEIQNYLYFLK